MVIFITHCYIANSRISCTLNKCILVHELMQTDLSLFQGKSAKEFLVAKYQLSWHCGSGVSVTNYHTSSTGFDSRCRQRTFLPLNNRLTYKKIRVRHKKSLGAQCYCPTINKKGISEINRKNVSIISFGFSSLDCQWLYNILFNVSKRFSYFP